MTKLEGFCDVSQAYNIYCEATSGDKIKLKPNEFRCNFFDWLYDQYDIDAVIACFIKTKPLYLDENSFQLKVDLRIPYPEIQICVYNKEIINNKRHYKG